MIFTKVILFRKIIDNTCQIAGMNLIEAQDMNFKRCDTVAVFEGAAIFAL